MSIGFTFVAIALLALSCNRHTDIQSTGKGLQFNTDSLHAGTVMKRKPIYKEIWLYNHGTEAETILNASASCNCTIVQFQKQPVAPKDSTSIVIEINTDQAPPGKTSETLVIRTNSKYNPLKYLTIAYTVLAVIHKPQH